MRNKSWIKAGVLSTILAIVLAGVLTVPASPEPASASQSYSATVTEEPWGYRYVLGNGDIVEVGDSATTDFKPHIKTIRYDGVASFTIWLAAAGSFTPILNDLTVTCDFAPNVRVSFYPVEPCERLPEGGFEYDITLLAKPVIVSDTFSYIFNIDWHGITWQKIPALDAEYDEARCEEEFGIEEAPYTITPTSIVGANGTVFKTREEYEVNSYLGAAIQNRHDAALQSGGIAYTRVSRTHLHIHRGFIVDSVGNTAWVEDINMDEPGRTITFTLPKDWIQNVAVYPIRQVCGVDPAYTQDMDSWDSDTYASDGVWSDYNLNSEKGVPKGTVAEIILENQDFNEEEYMGIRTDGSSLIRYVELHEAEAVPGTHCRMFVLCDSSTGNVETYHWDVSDDHLFYVVGYWENVGFTEQCGQFYGTSASAWHELELVTDKAQESDTQTYHLYSGGRTRLGGKFSITACKITEVQWHLAKTGSPTGTAYARVRQVSDDSIIGTLGSIDVSTLGGTKAWVVFNTTSVTVPAAQSIRFTIEYDGGSSGNDLAVGAHNTDTDVDLSYYEEGWTDDDSRTPTYRLTYLESVNQVTSVALENAEEAANTLGVRNTGSSVERKIPSHEAEGGGSNFLDMLVKTDSDGKIDVYTDDTTYGSFLFLGCFGTELDFVEKWQAISVTSSGWQSYDLTAYLDQDGRHCDFLLSHSHETSTCVLGARDGDDSSTERSLTEHEAESAGAGGEYAGFGMSAKSNASGNVYIRCDNTDNEGVYLTGYFKPSGVCSPSIELSQSSWNVNSGNPVAESSTYATGLSWCTITNHSGGTVDITIGGTDMTGGGHTWTLSDTATPGDMIYGLKAGLYGGNYTIIVKKNTPYNILVDDMADEATQDWGLKIWTPTNFDDGNEKSGTITLTAVCV